MFYRGTDPVRVRNIVAAICVFSLTGMAVIANEPNEAKEVETDFEPLSKRFLGALQSEHFNDTFVCWLTEEQFKEVVQDLPSDEAKPQAERIARPRIYFQQRDAILRLQYPMVLRALMTHDLDAQKLSYSSSSGNLQLPNGMPSEVQATTVDIVFAADDGRKVVFRFKNVYRLDGKWYFSSDDYRFWMIRNGKKVQFTNDPRE